MTMPSSLIDTVHVALLANPLDHEAGSPARWRHCDLPAGQTLAELFPGAAEDWTALVDGLDVPRSRWADCTPPAGAIITLTRAPGEPISTAIGLTSLLMSAGMSAAWAGAVGGFLVGTVISTGLSMVMNALIGPQTPSLNRDGAASTRYAHLTGARNEARPLQPLPHILGRCRVSPPLAAQNFTSVEGNDQYLYMLMTLSTGPVSVGGYLVGTNPSTGVSYPLLTQAKSMPANTIRIGETNLQNFDGVQFEIGAARDITLYSRVVIEEALAVQLDEEGEMVGGDGSAIALRTTEPDAVAFSVDLTFPALFATLSNGDMDKAAVRFLLEWKRSDSDQWPGGWQREIKVEKRSINPVRWTEQVEGLPAARYDVRLRRLDSGWAIENPTPDTHAGDCTWSVLRSIKSEKYRPYLRDTDTVVAVKALATGQLNGTLNTVNILATSVLRVWDGASWTWQANRNPAWCFVNALTGAQLDRPVPDSRLDLPAIKAWADWCWQNGLTYDWEHSTRENLLDKLRAICRCGRAEWALIDMLFSIVRDVDSPPVQVLAPPKCWNFKMERAYEQPIHGYRVRYFDGDVVDASASGGNTVTPRSNGQAEIVVLADGYSWQGKDAFGNPSSLPPATRLDVLETQGVNSAAQAHKEGRYFLAVRQLRPERFTVTCGAAALRCTRGDVVRLAYDVIKVGLSYGRVRSLDGATLTLDVTVTMRAGVSYAVLLEASDGTPTVFDVATVPGGSNVLTLTSPPPVDPLTGAPRYKYSDVAVFGEAGRETLAAKIVRIEYDAELNATVELVPAAPAVLDTDDEPIPAYDAAINGSIANRAPNPPRITAVGSGVYGIKSNTAGTSSASVSVAFVRPIGDVPTDTVDIRLYPATAGACAEQTKTLPADADSHIFEGLPFDTLIYVTARSHGQNGLYSDWTTPWGKTTVSAAQAPEPAGRILVLTASQPAFKYDGYGNPAPANQAITLTAKSSRLNLNTASWQAVRYSAAGQVLLPAPTLTGTGATRTLSVANFNGATTCTVTVSCDGHSDTVAIGRTDDGTSSVTGSLSQSRAYVAAEADGTGYSLASAYGVFEVHDGSVDVGAAGLVAYSVYTTNGANATIDSVGNYAITALTGGDEGSAVFRALYNNGSVTASIYRIFRAGILRKGVKGDAGARSQLLKLTADAQAFKYNKTGVATPASQAITLTAEIQNNTGTAAFAALLYDSNKAWIGTVALGGSGNTRTITDAQFGSAAYCRVSATISGDNGATYSDAVTIHRVGDGADGLAGARSQLLKLATDANSFKYNKVGVATPASQTITLTAEIQNNTGTAAFAALLYDSSKAWLGAVALGGSGNTRTITDSQFGSAAYCRVSATISGDNGATYSDAVTIHRVGDGADGLAGARAQTLRLSATSHAFTYDKAGAASPASQTVAVSADLQNLTGSAVFTCELFNASGGSLGLVTLGGSGNTRTLTSAQFGSAAYAVIIAQISGDSGTLQDIVRVVRVRDGADGVNGRDSVRAWLTNPSHVVASSDAGFVASYGSAGGTFRLFDGATDKSSSGQVTYSTTSISAGLSIGVDSSGNYTVYNLSGDSGTATIRANYGGVNYDEVYSLAKSKQGIQGIPGAAAQSIDLVATAVDFLFAPDNTPYPTSQIIRIDCLKQNILAGAGFVATLFDGGNYSMGAMSISQAADSCWLNIANFNVNAAYVQVSCTVTTSSGPISKYLQINKTPAWKQRYSGYLESAAYTTQTVQSWSYRVLFTSGVISSSASTKCKAICSARFSMDAAYWSGCGVNVFFGVWNVTGGYWLYSGASLYNRTNGADYHQEIQFTLPAGHQAQPYVAYMPDVSGGKVTCIYGYGAVEEIQ